MPLYARLRIVPPAPPVTIMRQEFDPRDGWRNVEITLPRGDSYAAELDCGAGRVFRVPGFYVSEGGARHAAVIYAARVLGRAVMPACLALAILCGSAHAGAERLQNVGGILCASAAECARVARTFGCFAASGGNRFRPRVNYRCGADSYRHALARHSA